jgi:hypothetical protein
MNGYDFQQSQMLTENPGLHAIITKMITDMRFVGIFTIIYGVITSLTILGALIGIPLIFSGMRLRDAAMEYERYLMSNDINAIFSGFERQQRSFFIQKVIIIVSIISFILYFVFLFIIIGSSGILDDLGNIQ